MRVTQLFYVAAKLGIADLLKDGAKSVDELASKVGAHPRALYRVLRALAGIGIFAEVGDRQFELTALAELQPLMLVYVLRHQYHRGRGCQSLHIAINRRINLILPTGQRSLDNPLEGDRGLPEIVCDDSKRLSQSVCEQGGKVCRPCRIVQGKRSSHRPLCCCVIW